MGSLQAHNSQIIWLVVLVESGIPTLVEAYPGEEDAVTREQFLRNTILSMWQRLVRESGCRRYKGDTRAREDTFCSSRERKLIVAERGVFEHRRNLCSERRH